MGVLAGVEATLGGCEESGRLESGENPPVGKEEKAERARFSLGLLFAVDFASGSGKLLALVRTCPAGSARAALFDCELALRLSPEQPVRRGSRMPTRLNGWHLVSSSTSK